MDQGAHFRRCDLQVHTPRDQHWQGTHYTTDEDRRDYASRFVRACRHKGLHAVAITDHHDLAFVPYIRDAASAELDNNGNPLSPDDRLTVFPGIELTLSVPCQALLILDADFPEEWFDQTLTALAIDHNDASHAMTANVTRVAHIATLAQLRDELDKQSFLRGRYIILPNVSDSGSDTLLRSGAATKYKTMPCVGGYLDGSIERLGHGNRNILGGRDPEYGHKRIALFQTSDNRREDHNDLGSVSTWIKWAVPSAEALRQACLAQESRVSQTQPRLPSVTIQGISVRNSSFLGPVDLDFNPQYNALIGGRGTGKSTILEYLRWALCDQPPPSDEADDTPNYQARRRRLIDDTLKPLGATVDVRLQVHGVPHVIRRDSADGKLMMKIGDHELQSCSEEDVRRLFPIQAYSQKQLSDVSVRIEELSRFIEGPVRPQLDAYREQIEALSARIRETYSLVLRRRTLDRTLVVRELAETSLSEQVDSLRTGLAGLSDEDRALLERGPSYSRGDQAVNSWRNGIRTFNDAASRLHQTIASLLDGFEFPNDVPEEQTLRAAADDYRSLLAHALTDLDALIARAERIAGSSDDDPGPWATWSRKRHEFTEAYDAALMRSSSREEQTKRLSDLEQDLQRGRGQSGRFRDEQRTLSDVEEQCRALRQEWLRIIQERDDTLDGQCATLTADSGNAIRAHVHRLSNTSDFVAFLKKAISGSRVPGAKIDAIGASISASETIDDGRTICADILDELERLAEYDEKRDGLPLRPAAPTLVKLGLTAANLDGIARKLDLDDWLTLSLIPIVSEPVFEFRAREKEYIPFRNASAGQQATALLQTLLNQNGPPLIIDQPEEDLDNPVILEIVANVWQAKQQRQLIFASHNANLVVNGDAELVAWCDHRTAVDQSGGTIAGQGAIDVEDVREAIKKIMEGGEHAFNLRKEKYGF